METNVVIAVPTSHGYHFKKRHSLSYCIKKAEFVELTFADQSKYQVKISLNQLGIKLASPEFIRIHQSHVVNLRYVVKYINNNQNIVIMTDGEELEVSRKNRGLLTDHKFKL
jgi:two-component system LytT family response regulator